MEKYQELNQDNCDEFAFDNLKVEKLPSDVLNIFAEELPNDWMKLAHSLKISSEEIDRVLHKYKTAREQTFEIFNSWCRKNPEKTWGELKSVLFLCQRNDVIFKCEKKLTARSIFGVQPSSDKLFLRNKELSEIHSYLFDLKDAKNSTLVLYGMSGVGKTQLAKKYCEIYCKCYKNFVWIDAAIGKLQTSINNVYQKLGNTVQKLKIEYFDIEVIVEKIHNFYKNEKTLYIFDNVDDDFVRNLELYISNKPNSFNLITSQSITWSNNVNKMLIDVFSFEDAFAYVKNNIKERTDTDLERLIEELGYHPFAITQATKYINMHKLTIEKYICQYRSKSLQLLDDNNSPAKGSSSIKAINMLLKKLEKTQTIPLKILNCLSHCDGQNISKKFIIEISKQLNVSEEHLVDEAIELLMSYSLLDRFNDQKYSMHNLTQLSCICFQSKNSSINTYLDLIENCIKLELNKVKHHVDYGNHFVFHFLYLFRNYKKRMLNTFHHMTTSIKKLLVCKGLFQQAIEILKAVQNFNAETYGANNKLTLDTKHNMAYCLYKMRKYNEALEILYPVDKKLTEILGISHPSTMTIKHNIASCLHKMKNYDSALEIYYSVNKRKTEILCVNHPSTIATKHNIARCLYEMRKYNEALEVLYSVEKIKTEILDINHPFTMTTKNNIALCLHKMGKHNEALKIFNSVHERKSEVLGMKHQSTTTTKRNIASCLHKMGKCSEALEIYYSVDEILTEILDINHTSKMATKHNIALCLHQMRNYSKALEIYYSVDAILTEILGMKHPSIVTTKHNIASCLQKMGKSNEALKIYHFVHKMQIESLGINHQTTIKTKRNIASCLLKIGNYKESLEIYFSVNKILTQILGINHPSTMTTKHDIALCLQKIGRYNESLEMYYTVDKMQTELLDRNHLSIMTTKHNFGSCLRKMGKYNEALEIFNSVHKRKSEVLGMKHQSTIATKRNIASCLRKMGKWTEANEIYHSVDKILTETLGMKHPSTMTTKHHIALCLFKVGKYRESLEINNSVHKIRTEILGVNHPSTMITKHNIANCLRKMGKCYEALEIYYSVDKVLTQTLGVNHPSTMTTKHNIELCRHEMGKHNKI
ncbi:uncharacterized protein LOC105846300 isoform X2 [Hydra vulgaris]|uniref:Uncharacterized protein LOC105846300 isoform X2 n=1 Tax=Hydra vulgaris TaxID=6087 RepID=A0ABM4CNX3_HYDVU